MTRQRAFDSFEEPSQEAPPRGESGDRRSGVERRATRREPLDEFGNQTRACSWGERRPTQQS